MTPSDPGSGAAPRIPSAAPAAAGGRRYSPLLDVVRIVAVAGVVTVHVIADHLDSGSTVAMHVLRSLLSTAVPAFIMISGALNLAPAAMRDGSARFLGRRLRRLVPATVVWTVFYAGVMGILLSDGFPNWHQEILDLLTASSYPHLYFLPLVLGLTVITPVVAAYVGDSGHRAWICGAVATGWTLVVMAMPTLTAGLLEEPLVPLELGLFTYFLPYIGYYVLGRAAWAAPVGHRGALWLLLGAVPLTTGVTVWAYLSRLTDTPPGQFLLPTYVAPTVMLLSLTLVIALMALGRDWTVPEGTERVLRRVGDATFGVFLVHFAVLMGLRELGWPEESVLTVTALLVVVTAASFAISLLGKQVPGLRAIL